MGPTQSLWEMALALEEVAMFEQLQNTDNEATKEQNTG